MCIWQKACMGKIYSCWWVCKTVNHIKKYMKAARIGNAGNIPDDNFIKIKNINLMVIDETVCN